MMDHRINLVGLSREEMVATFASIGEKPFRANQVWHWIYHRGQTDFAKMTTLSKSLRDNLKETCVVGRPQVARALVSEDASRKWLVRFDDGNEVETVLIPETDRGALCVSSQVGCTLNCAFCHTGTQLRVRDLTAAEIVGQVMLARDQRGEWPSGVDGRQITNIVMMGMGEPLMNYDNVAKALRILTDGEGIAISKRRITLSTSGVVPLMGRLGRELDVDLAVSLHAPRDEVRDILVPINRKYPIDQLLKACRDYPGASNARRITMEYVMIKDVNDSDADARELARLMRMYAVPAKFNLIPFNPWPGTDYECSSNNRVRKFSQILNDEGFSAPIRQPRGRDIMAACGQLKSASEHARKRENARTVNAA
ncbi:23S rRNA (adenine(2503)-C(2))-methyltransferase RlmN [Varunaivibrio sulfuroxidans]|uniref:Dual-specificity RNA methyltransferase RlmN n=1 Tax=Varunaivibrio sulfuroxidans TaxID=1773489 RepID=A0A4R3JHP9_9PROT|nr:23S rRNA (adenine(2503)-C(2))-methyltransferase RlmN [Varunaivibrio sulfuroxidans]TCS64786.1 23S rRNA m(2)A-2503 methyltransferase [Varunaivibrio sulfuroxidans]WES29910.1 23S rRNA (adenine(2503)-C(2))-methyltransferase RlmN [Varunaivibrio sulfuroxidans]